MAIQICMSGGRAPGQQPQQQQQQQLQFIENGHPNFVTSRMMMGRSSLSPYSNRPGFSLSLLSIDSSSAINNRSLILKWWRVEWFQWEEEDLPLRFIFLQDRDTIESIFQQIFSWKKKEYRKWEPIDSNLNFQTARHFSSKGLIYIL